MNKRKPLGILTLLAVMLLSMAFFYRHPSRTERPLMTILPRYPLQRRP